MDNKLLTDLVSVMKEYLGPAAERFVARQISYFLRKTPADLSRDDLPKLAEWMRVKILVLSDDIDLAEEMSKKIKNLEDKNHSMLR